ncbi:hypothetical protein G6F57_020855 [Rhizopus arrhizus]|nr:hypothetical protein G6F57_020855 [Rhizopus arrhizus]
MRQRAARRFRSGRRPLADPRGMGANADGRRPARLGARASRQRGKRRRADPGGAGRRPAACPRRPAAGRTQQPP